MFAFVIHAGNEDGDIAKSNMYTFFRTKPQITCFPMTN